MKELWRCLDWDGSGEISCEEFLDLVAQVEGPLQDAEDTIEEEVLRTRRMTERLASKSVNEAESAGSLDGSTHGSPSKPTSCTPTGSVDAAPCTVSKDELTKLKRLVEGVASLRASHAAIVQAQKTLGRDAKYALGAAFEFAAGHGTLEA